MDCRPPHGGRGLKYCSPQESELFRRRRPPHGGRGLKYLRAVVNDDIDRVALPTEGAD